MATKEKQIGKNAQKYWDERDFAALVRLCPSPRGGKSLEVLYFAGLAYHALDKKREAIECWRRARELFPEDEHAIRALAFELAEKDPISAADLFYHLIGLNRAQPDDLTALGEICIKQDRLTEAQRWLERALEQDQQNSLALLSMATLYAHVRGRDLALDYLRKAADTGDIDLSDLASDPEFEFLWHDAEFERIVSQNGKET
jgi:tetratricopeptide (TPR) repeat protein